MALNNHAALERVTRVQLLPPIDRTHFHTHHVLVPVLRLEVSHAFCLLDPRVPDYGVDQVVADHIESWLAVLQDRGGVLLDGGVDAICLAGDGE